jgi:hypothetical protein
MIDIALKHYIYDLCIDVLFNGFARNFKKVFRIKVGDKFNLLVQNNLSRSEFYDVTVTKVYKDKQRDLIDIRYGKALFFSTEAWFKDDPEMKKSYIADGHKFYKKIHNGKKHDIWEVAGNIEDKQNTWSFLDIYRIEI